MLYTTTYLHMRTGRRMHVQDTTTNIHSLCKTHTTHLCFLPLYVIQNCSDHHVWRNTNHDDIATTNAVSYVPRYLTCAYAVLVSPVCLFPLTLCLGCASCEFSMVEVVLRLLGSIFNMYSVFKIYCHCSSPFVRYNFTALGESVHRYPQHTTTTVCSGRGVLRLLLFMRFLPFIEAMNGIVQWAEYDGNTHPVFFG